MTALFLADKLRTWLDAERPIKQLLGYPSRRRTENKAPPCVNSAPAARWINKPEVRRVLNVQPGVPDWAMCRNLDYTTLYQDMLHQYRALGYWFSVDNDFLLTLSSIFQPFFYTSGSIYFFCHFRLLLVVFGTF